MAGCRGRRSSEDQDSMIKAPKEECEELMNALLPMGKKLLSAHGSSSQWAEQCRPMGQLHSFSTYDGDEHPPSQRVIDSLMEVFRAGAKRKKYRFPPVRCRSASDPDTPHR